MVLGVGGCMRRYQFSKSVSQHQQEQSRYLDAGVVSKTNWLGLRARMVVEGMMSGMHRSPYRGSGVEFSQHRAYVAGDDIRFLDWKIYGKTNRLYLKQYHQETNLDLIIMLDASLSMAYAGHGSVLQSGNKKKSDSIDDESTNVNIIRRLIKRLKNKKANYQQADNVVQSKTDDKKNYASKFDFSATLAASISLLGSKQQDRIALSVFNNQYGKQLISLSNKQGHWKSIVNRLEMLRLDVIQQTEKQTQKQKRYHKESHIKEAIDHLIANLSRRSLVVLISDLFIDIDVIKEALAKLSHCRHDVVVFQVLDKDEEKFLYERSVEFVDLENDGHLIVDPAAIRDAYLEKMNLHRKQIETHTRNFGFDFICVKTNESISAVLDEFLSKRQSMFARGMKRCS